MKNKLQQNILFAVLLSSTSLDNIHLISFKQKSLSLWWLTSSSRNKLWFVRCPRMSASMKQWWKKTQEKKLWLNRFESRSKTFNPISKIIAIKTIIIETNKERTNTDWFFGSINLIAFWRDWNGSVSSKWIRKLFFFFFENCPFNYKLENYWLWNFDFDPHFKSSDDWSEVCEWDNLKLRESLEIIYFIFFFSDNFSSFQILVLFLYFFRFEKILYF